MRQVRILAALGLLAAATANAEVSSTWTLTNDYDFRGISQSAKDPAVQASIDYAQDSGWYIGAWASNVDFGDDADIDSEVDLYTGFTGGDEEGLGWDVGLVYYAYPDESDANYPEIYGKLNYGLFSGALFYSNDYVNSGDSALYISGDVEAPLPQNFTFLAHAGYSFGDYWDGEDGESGSDYIDWAIGVGYTVGNFDLSLKWVDTTLDEGDFGFSDDDVFNSEGRVVFMVSTTFPWGGE